MTRSELQDYGANEPVWRFIAQLARERFTGQADVGTDVRVELYAAEGRVYFAQKSDDPPLGARLVSTGALTSEQFRNGSVKVGDTVSLARLFQRVPALDRDAVELMTDKLSQHALEAVSERPVGAVTLHPLRFHPSGIHQWFPDAGPAPEDDEPSPAMTALVQDVVAAVSGQIPVIPATMPIVPQPDATEAVVTEPDVTEPDDTEPAVSEPALAEPVQPDAEPAEPAAPSMTFQVLDVALASTGETALPTLSSLQGLTPLPTLGEVGTRMPAPTAVPQPGIMDTQGLPILGSVGTSFHPSAIAAAADEASEPADEMPAELEPAREPTDTVTTAARSTLPPGSPLPPPTLTASPFDSPAVNSTLTAPVAGAPAGEGETVEIWDMVDDLLGIPHSDGSLVNAGGMSDDKKSRGWLRGRRG